MWKKSKDHKSEFKKKKKTAASILPKVSYYD
jgi:phage antirepressor YoqD-like protein